MNTKMKIGLAGVVLLMAAYFAMVYTTRHEPGVNPSLATSKTTAIPTTQVAQPMASAVHPSPTPSPTAKVEPFAMPPEGVTAKLTPDLLKNLLQNNAIAIAYAQGLPGDLNLGYTAIRITKKWTADDPAGALAWAQGLPIDLQKITVKLIFNQLGTKDPQAALALAQTLPMDSTERTLALEGLAEVAKILSITDPDKGAALSAEVSQSGGKK